jgi:uncharacterized repeat protein (TIGR02543 family)
MKRFTSKRAITASLVRIKSRVGGCGNWKLRSILLLLLSAGLGAREATAGAIFVTSLEQKVASRNDTEQPGCSLQEAIYAANFDDNIAIEKWDSAHSPVFVRTNCNGGSGDDVIVLPINAVLRMDKTVDDAFNPFGPTATPLVTTNITIEAHGATLQFVSTQDPRGHLFHHETVPEYFRAFAVGSTGHLTIKNAYVRGFVTHGGNGGFIATQRDFVHDVDVFRNEQGGGGGMGAGGAIFVHAGGLLVEACTFEGNGAIGGDGAGSVGHTGGGGGGGLGGWGGPASCDDDGGGGGGSRGYGVGSCAGDGGGTLEDADNGRPGFACGGLSGWRGNHEGGAVDDGEDAPCAGGGGGGGGASTFSSYNGGKGNYGGGGGGGGKGAHGGDGGFGGGGGAGWAGTLFGSNGGNGGFGGGGGAGPNASVTDGDPGEGGMFGGDANHNNGGGGAALGGAIFNDGGNVLVRNSTFTANFVSRGNGGGAPNPGQGANGAGAGGAIFSRNGSLTVQFSTIAGNEATGSGGGIVVVRDGADTHFTLHNSIVANNGATECSILGTGVVTGLTGNVIEANDGCGDPVSIEDPQLGPLQANQGPTPTMAISRTGSAFNAADSNFPFPKDQRGQDRPSMGGDDAGAFELCLEGPEILQVPCLIIADRNEDDSAYLTIQVSPDATGTTSPSPGVHREPLNSVILLSATPNPGYHFLGWTGSVTSPSSPQTTVVMDEDKTVTANFELDPDFTFSPVSPLTLTVGGTGSRTVTVNANATFDQTVALSTLGLPAGASRSFNPTSLTPALGGSASSQLSLTLGPSVLPGPYSLSVVGTSGSLVHSTALGLTVVASPASVSGVIGTLGALGCIDSSGVVNAFKAKLAQAQAAIDAGDYQTAINLLTALLQQLQAQAGKHLKTTCTDANGNTFDPVQTLIHQVNDILTALNTNLKANPITGTLLNASNIEVAGATINIISASRTIVSATTDATGFYVFPKITALKLGTDYTVRVTLPKGYKLSTPASQMFKWNATMVTLPKFVVK